MYRISNDAATFACIPSSRRDLRYFSVVAINLVPEENLQGLDVKIAVHLVGRKRMPELVQIPGVAIRSATTLALLSHTVLTVQSRPPGNLLAQLQMMGVR